MLEVSRTQHVDAPLSAVWADLDDHRRFAEWFTFCDTVEEPEPGTRVLLGSWGSRRSAVTVRITERDEPRRLAWRHVREELDGDPAPRMSAETTVEVVLDDDGAGGTDVTIISRQEPAGWLQRLVLSVAGKRQVAGMLESSLTLLAARHRDG